MSPMKQTIKIRGEFCIETKAAPCGLVIFGASGDLTSRKLIPALFNLYQQNLVAGQFFILGCARTPMNDDTFRDQLREALREQSPDAAQDRLDSFLQLCHYQSGNYDDPAFYEILRERIASLDESHRTLSRRLFYCAVPPTVYAHIIENLGHVGLTREDGNGNAWARVIVEKPFGHDLTSALELDRKLYASLREHQIYRIDHYLGKETVQNILMLRFANVVFEPMWNRDYVDHVQITVAESLGVGSRAGYFEQAGVMRDMFQNHMLQMLALVGMEPPASFEANRVRDERVKLLRSIRPVQLDDLQNWIVRGQYAASARDGQTLKGYREEEGVAADSAVDTFVAAKLMIDNWRWQGVPFYLRSGKRLPQRVSEIAITFKRIPHSMFSPIAAEEFSPNVLVLRVQPNEGVSLTIQTKHPGPKLCMSSLTMDFNYNEVFDEEPPEAYQRLLLDAMLGDQTLFVRHDDMEVSWSLITPVLERWAAMGDDGVHPYEAGTWGPRAADELLAKDGRRWRKEELE